jgi:hypothetical protein
MPWSAFTIRNRISVKIRYTILTRAVVLFGISNPPPRHSGSGHQTKNMNFPETDIMRTDHLPGAPNQLSETPGDDWLDISAGAAHFCLRQPVQIHRQIISDYMEADATLGVNVIGAILSSLIWRSTRPGDESGEAITVALRRRADRQPVEVYLEVLPVGNLPAPTKCGPSGG